MRPALPIAVSLLPLLAGACAAPARPAPADVPLAVAESAYATLRDLRDRFEVAAEAGRTTAGDGVPLSHVAERHDARRAQLATVLAAVDSAGLRGDDARALGVMRRTLARDLGPLAAATAAPPDATVPDCAYDPAALARQPGGIDSLRRRIYGCYGRAQSRVVVGPDTMDRLSVLAALGRTDDAARRRVLFFALAPVWRSVNGDDASGSPYRRLIALEAEARRGAESRTREQALAAGVPPDSLEPWLRSILAAWREAIGDTLVEPWDWYYRAGRAARALSARIPTERLAGLNDEVWRALGADVRALRVHYELVPREGKDPVAFTTFGGRTPIEPWVFATYRTGGLDNLNELLHETGHAVHIAAIRTRAAFRDWPDSDPFTEAVADLIALDVYEPAWQQRWLGDSVPLADGLRGRYGGIVMDVAWALFEVQMLRDPGADPNEVWTGLTRDYLRVRPHPELSWWAMRGQLVDEPGYMMNYAVGAMLIAAVRARIRAEHGPFVTGDTTLYAWLAPRLYRFGLERPARSVVADFLGGPVTPDALLADLRRMRD